MNEPPVIQCLWIGKQMSRMEKMSMKSFLKNSYSVHVYTYDYIEDMPAGVALMDANKIIPPEKIFKYKGFDSYAGFANLFRYKLLLEKGGYWSDLDIICIKPFPAGLQYLFASQRQPDQTVQVNNCLIGAPPNSGIMDYCYSIAHNKNPDELKWGETGPELLSQAVIQFELEDHVAHPDVICPVDYWNCQYFVTKCIDDLIHENTYTIHLWNEMWRRNKMDKSILYDDHCLYEELQIRYNT